MTVEGANLGKTALRLVARDLGAPLALLRQLTFELDNEVALAGVVGTSRACAEMRQAVEQMYQLVDKLNLLADSSAKLALEPIPLRALCHDLGEELAPLTRERQREIRFVLPRRDVVVTGNYGALKSITRGFLTDATRYLAPTDSKSAGTLETRVTCHDNGEVSLLISDDGPAVNLSQTLKQLQRNQAVPITARPLSSGLNLLLADSAVRAMNGELKVHNHRRGGVTIETRLLASRQLSLLGD